MGCLQLSVPHVLEDKMKVVFYELLQTAFETWEWNLSEPPRVTA